MLRGTLRVTWNSRERDESGAEMVIQLLPRQLMNQGGGFQEWKGGHCSGAVLGRAVQARVHGEGLPMELLSAETSRWGGSMSEKEKRQVRGSFQ